MRSYWYNRSISYDLHIHLHFGNGVECRWSPCFSLQSECRTEPDCAEGENRQRQQVVSRETKNDDSLKLHSLSRGTDRVLVVSSGAVRASRRPRLLKYSALPSLMVPQPSPICPPLRLCHSELSFPSKSSESSVGLGADGTQLDRSISTEHKHT